MTFDEFEKVQDKLLSQVISMTDTKGKEYANSDNRFANFNRLADRMGIERSKIWLVYFTKHMDSIEHFIKTGSIPSQESIEGRIVDAITYLTLLHGMVVEDSLQESCRALGVNEDGTPVGGMTVYPICGEPFIPKGVGAGILTCTLPRTHSGDHKRP